MEADPVEVNGRPLCSVSGCAIKSMPTERWPTTAHRVRSGAKPGATREQIERRERFQRARRESLQPAPRTRRRDVWLAYGDGGAAKPGAAAAQAARHRECRAAAGRRGHRALARAGDRAARRDRRALAAGCRAQGLYAETDPLPSPPIEELARDGVVLVLDQITDPHNVGAIFRSAAAFAATAIVTTARHSPEATGVLAKSASGALEHVPLVSVQNLARALAALKERGFLVVGLDCERRGRSRRAAAARAARARARRRRQGAAATDQGNLRPRRAARSAGRDPEPQCVERRGARALRDPPQRLKTQRRAPSPPLAPNRSSIILTRRTSPWCRNCVFCGIAG